MNDRTSDRYDLNQLLHPAQAFEHPSEVVNDPDLTLNEKRAILASWASDACAIEAAPDLRSNPAALRCGSMTSWRRCGRSIGKPTAIATGGGYCIAARAHKPLGWQRRLSSVAQTRLKSFAAAHADHSQWRRKELSMLSAVDRHVIARESNIVRVDFSREPDPPAPRFPGANGLRPMLAREGS